MGKIGNNDHLSSVYTEAWTELGNLKFGLAWAPTKSCSCSQLLVLKQSLSWRHKMLRKRTVATNTSYTRIMCS